MRRITAGIAGLAIWALAGPAAAFNCAVPGIISAAKKAVCADPLLAAIDRTETQALGVLSQRLPGDARRAVARDRRTFLATRDGCADDTRCLEATYRAQVRLYRKLEVCLAPGAKTVFCVGRTLEQHGMELHRSL